MSSGLIVIKVVLEKLEITKTFQVCQPFISSFSFLNLVFHYMWYKLRSPPPDRPYLSLSFLTKGWWELTRFWWDPTIFNEIQQDSTGFDRIWEDLARFDKKWRSRVWGDLWVASLQIANLSDS